MSEVRDFSEALENKKIPILVLDQKWHRLFDATGKSNKIKYLESEVNRYLGRQGQLNQEIKDLKGLKNTLMGNIMANMEGTSDNVNTLFQKKLDADKRLITEINERLEEHEADLGEIPRQINEVNKELMVETMNFCYETLRTNSEEIIEIAEWIRQVRIDLKKNILIKQNREINNRVIYNYLHDVFGAEVVDKFDLRNNDIRLSMADNRDLDDISEIAKGTK